MSLPQRVIGLAAALLTAGAACGAFSGSDASNPTPATDAAALDDGASADGAMDDGAGFVDPDDAGMGILPFDPDAGTVDGGEGGTSAACVPVAPTNIVSIKDATDAVVCANSSTSQLAAISASDGKPVGLDLKFGGVAVQIDGTNVTTCVGVEFGVPISSAIIRMRSVAAACGVACNGACNTGHTVWFFAGANAGALSVVSHGAATASFQSFKMTVPAGGRVVAVCRAGYAAADDDIEVDSILACPP